MASRDLSPTITGATPIEALPAGATHVEAATTVYVVSGSTGEYSDRSEWLTLAFNTEAEAQSYIELLTEKRQQLASQGDGLDWNEREAVVEAMRAFDRGYSEDYTGTVWFIQSVSLAASQASGEG